MNTAIPRINTFQQLIAAARQRGPRRVVLAAADQPEALQAAAWAYRDGLAEFTLVGPAPAIQGMLSELGLSIGEAAILHEDGPRAAARRAVEVARKGEADLIMNGRCQPTYLIQLLSDPANALSLNRQMSDVTLFEIPGVERLILVSDIMVVAAPNLEQKRGIVQNAIDVAVALGISPPKVAILSATEMVNPKIPVSLDAANLAKMAQRGQIKGGLVDGPLAFDNAISAEAARIKGIQSEVAGQADILIAPDIEAGNILAKAISHFAGGKMASVVVGCRWPLILPSRSDPPEAKLASLALGVYLTTL
jgi:phosphate butyryltransferase